MYQKILVPLDGSKPAEAVLPYTRELAKGLGSQITLISVLPTGSQKGKAQYKHLHQFYMQEMLKSLKIKELIINSVILSGEPAEIIADYAQKKGFNLILMGTRGRSALKRWVLGSVADKVISLVKIPVALVATSEDNEYFSQMRNVFRKSLIVLDGLAESEVVIPYAEELTSSFKMEVTLLQVVKQAYEFYYGMEDYSSIPVSNRAMGVIKAKARRYLNEMAGRLEGTRIKTRVEVAKGKPAETIIQVASEIGTDTLFLATRGRSGLSRWFFYSIRDDAVNIGNILVLLVSIPE